MPMRRVAVGAITFALGVVIVAPAPRVSAAPDDEEEATDDEGDARDSRGDRGDERDSRDRGGKKPKKKFVKSAPSRGEDADGEGADGGDGGDSGDDDEGDARDARPARRAKAAATDEDDRDFKKQDLTGHDLGPGSKKENLFERDRFFVDKTDTEKTEATTLIQGSITSTTFGYHEAGDILTPPVSGGAPVPSASQFNRLFTELRLQTDFRHISGSRWEARVDVRGRMVNDPGTSNADYDPVTNSSVQSGFLGKNELEVKELWLVRSGPRSDLFIGRQFIADLGGVKIDGLRIDYASSSKFTFVGFGGLYPIRGSRSITTDYSDLRSNPATDGTRSSAGKYTGAGGFGAAYRTLDAYGSFGGVAIVPLSSESPRVFATSTGYWRKGTKLDFYHLAVLDLVGSNAVNAGLTNLSLGMNYKPDQRLRATASLHRVDTETLNVQAQAFLTNPDPGVNVIQNEAYLTRIATNQVRGSLSAGLGSMQRFEITAGASFRHRGDVTLSAPPQDAGTPATAKLPSAQSAEVYGSITDRRSVADLRLGVDGSRIFGVGSVTYHRTASTSLRVFGARDIANGQGEWEAEAMYTTTQDDNAGMTCGAEVITCYGASRSKILALGGNVYYRINRDWFTLGSVFLNRTEITHVDVGVSTVDPPVTGISGYFRIAYRF
jgi:hypothetical protein